MANTTYDVNDLYFCKYATAESIKLINLKELVIKATNRKAGLFVKLNEKEYMHVLTGQVMKVNVKPALGQTWIRDVKPLSYFVDKSKKLSTEQIEVLEQRVNDKQAKLKRTPASYFER